MDEVKVIRAMYIMVLRGRGGGLFRACGVGASKRQGGGYVGWMDRYLGQAYQDFTFFFLSFLSL